jgi:hypothetical protein
MDGRTVAAVALRIWGVVLLLQALAAVPGVVLAIKATSGPEESAQFGHAVQNALLCQLGASAILALCLLLWAESIARRAVPETAPLQLGLEASQLLSIGLLLVGVVTLIQGLKDAASLAYALATKPKWVEASATSYLWERECGTVVSAAVNSLAGIVLILGRSGISRAWAQLCSLAQTGHGVQTR